MSFADSSCINALDLGVIVDISWSVGNKNLPSLKKSLERLVDMFNISSSGTHMGMILFGGTAELQFNFANTKFHDPASVKNEISTITKLIKGTRTDKALIMANKELFTAAGGDRPDKPNVLLVFTDGKPTRPYKPFSETIPPLEVGISLLIFYDCPSSYYLTRFGSFHYLTLHMFCRSHCLLVFLASVHLSLCFVCMVRFMFVWGDSFLLSFFNVYLKQELLSVHPYVSAF